MDYNTYDKVTAVEVIVQSENEKALIEHILNIDSIQKYRVVVTPSQELTERVKLDIKSSSEESITIIVDSLTAKQELLNFLIQTLKYDTNGNKVKQKRVEIFVWHNKAGTEGFYQMLYDCIADNPLSQSVKAVIKGNRDNDIVAYLPEMDDYIATKTYLLWQKNPAKSIESAIEDRNINVIDIFTEERKTIKQLTSVK